MLHYGTRDIHFAEQICTIYRRVTNSFFPEGKNKLIKMLMFGEFTQLIQGMFFK